MRQGLTKDQLVATGGFPASFFEEGSAAPKPFSPKEVEFKMNQQSAFGDIVARVDDGDDIEE